MEIVVVLAESDEESVALEEWDVPVSPMIVELGVTVTVTVITSTVVDGLGQGHSPTEREGLPTKDCGSRGIMAVTVGTAPTGMEVRVALIIDTQGRISVIVGSGPTAMLVSVTQGPGHSSTVREGLAARACGSGSALRAFSCLGRFSQM